MAYALNKETEVKIVSISSKRQITIPQKFFSALGFGGEAECIMHDDELIIRPVKSSVSGEFDEFILADLIKEGLSGDALLSEFKRRRKKVRPAVEQLIEEARDAAYGKGDSCSYNDIFGSEEE